MDRAPADDSQAEARDQTDFQRLQQALLNEKVAPEILAYQQELVERVTAAIQQQEDFFDAVDADQDSPAEALELEVLALERDRMRYLLKSYLRTRLLKIQEYSMLVLGDEDVQARVSDQELQFAEGVFTAAGAHAKSAVLDALPANYQSLTRRYEGEAPHSLVMRPDTNAMVFARALCDVGQLAQGAEGETALVSAGDQLVIKYSTVAPYVASGQVCLR